MGVSIKELYTQMQEDIKELMAVLNETTEDFRLLLESDKITKEHLLRCQNGLLKTLACRLECMASTQALADHLELLKLNPEFMKVPENVEGIQISIDRGRAFNSGASETINLLKSNLVKLQFQTGIKLQPLQEPTVPTVELDEELEVVEKPKSRSCTIQ